MPTKSKLIKNYDYFPLPLIMLYLSPCFGDVFRGFFAIKYLLGNQLAQFNTMNNGLSSAVTIFWFPSKKIIITSKLVLRRKVAERIATICFQRLHRREHLFGALDNLQSIARKSVDQNHLSVSMRINCY